MKIIRSFFWTLTLFLLSCKSGIDENQKAAILKNADNINDFCDITKIEAIGSTDEGKLFTCQKFLIGIRFKRDCKSNIAENLCVSYLGFVEPQTSEGLDSRTNLIFKGYRSGDTLTVHGVLFAYKGKNNVFMSKANTMFYRIGKDNVLKDATPTQVCNELNRYFEAGVKYLEIVGDDRFVYERELKTADKSSLIALGFDIFKTGYLNDFSENKMSGEDLVSSLTGIALIPYAHFEDNSLKCLKN